jgi:Enterobacter phage Enc34, ssDNA-binding protein
MADEKKKDEATAHLKDVRLFFPVLFVKKAYKPGQKENFNAKFGIAKERTDLLTEVQAAMIVAAKRKWPVDWEQNLKMCKEENRICVINGDNRSTVGYKGNFVLSANNDTKPRTLDRNRTELLTDTGRLYSGCYVNAIVSFWAQDNGFGKRINANLMGVQFWRDGEAFAGGGVASADEFEDGGNGEGEALGVGTAADGLF